MVFDYSQGLLPLSSLLLVSRVSAQGPPVGGPSLAQGPCKPLFSVTSLGIFFMVFNPT